MNYLLVVIVVVISAIMVVDFFFKIRYFRKKSAEKAEEKRNKIIETWVNVFTDSKYFFSKDSSIPLDLDFVYSMPGRVPYEPFLQNDKLYLKNCNDGSKYEVEETYKDYRNVFFVSSDAVIRLSWDLFNEKFVTNTILGSVSRYKYNNLSIVKIVSDEGDASYFLNGKKVDFPVEDVDFEHFKMVSFEEFFFYNSKKGGISVYGEIRLPHIDYKEVAFTNSSVNFENLFVGRDLEEASIAGEGVSIKFEDDKNICYLDKDRFLTFESAEQIEVANGILRASLGGRVLYDFRLESLKENIKFFPYPEIGVN